MKYSFFSKIWKSTFTKNSSLWLVIAIAVIPLVMVQQITDNMIEGISLRIIETDSAHINMSLASQSTKAGRDSIRNTLESNPNVLSTYEELRGVGIIKNGNKKLGISLRGVENSFFEEQGVSSYLTLVDGELDLDKKRTVIIGSAVAKNLGLKVGDSALFLTSRLEETDSLPKISRATVQGIVSTGYEILDRTWVFMNSTQLQRLLLPDDQVWAIGLKISDPFLLENDLIKRSASKQAQGKKILSELEALVFDQGVLYTWYESNKNTFSLFLSTKFLLNMALIIAVILSVITLASAMGMRIVDLEIEIATLKAIGANPAQIEMQIVLKGLWYGFSGSLLGSIVGTILASQINYMVRIVDGGINVFRRILGAQNSISILNPEFYLTNIDFKFYPANFFFVVIMVMVCSSLASWIPSRRVRNISSLKLLRSH